ncbi:hypothetical protein EV660_102707 [Roseinatronobacter bogoriensis DSM 18756]|nr:hypothetical protein [Rhodobaca bogoriensis DSM 18756]TDY71024.1 hypothetical protein EV660_102707 [Rhodobaca bogoriensis DSM 18756]
MDIRAQNALDQPIPHPMHGSIVMLLPAKGRCTKHVSEDERNMACAFW